MEVGGRDALAAIRKPLTSAADGSHGSDLEAALEYEGGSGVDASLPIARSLHLQGTAAQPRGPSRTGLLHDRAGARGLQVEAAFAAAAAAGAATGDDVGGRRRMPGTSASLRRVTTPIRTSTDARSKLERSLRADGACFAVCVAGNLDLEGLMGSLAPRMGEETVQQLTDDSPTSLPSRAPAGNKASLASLAGTLRSRLLGWWRRLFSRTGPSPRGAAPQPKAELSLGGAEFMKGYGTGENLVLHLKAFRGKDLFVFRFGCLVCWSFDKREISVMKERLRPFMVRALAPADIEEESMEFVIKRRREGEEEDDDDDHEGEGEDASTGASAVKQDQIVLTTTSPFERLAHAYALAQSVRLGVFEIVVDRSIGNTRSIPETMAETGEVQLDARELSKQIGGLLMLRCDVNLHTDILDTPEIFWDEERFEPHYVACRGYLDIDKRVEILNQRLGVLKDLYDLLQNSLNVKHGNKLEWIVIILILVEVVLELLELLHDAWAG
mmetsp:Transcript_70156/g.218001  ORF Transcript_70156/g.218001 Transcript_70156/m.218001 type:complete len:497 (-) Transcript_70156:42-1532(-)